MATDFVAAAIDLLIAVEDADKVLLPDGVEEAAGELRAVIDRGGW